MVAPSESNRQPNTSPEKYHPQRLMLPFNLFEPGPGPIAASNISATELVREFDGSIGDGITALRADLDEDGWVLGFWPVSVMSTNEEREKILAGPPHYIHQLLDDQTEPTPVVYFVRVDNSAPDGTHAQVPISDQERLKAIMRKVEGEYLEWKNLREEETVKENFRKWVGEKRAASLPQNQAMDSI